jgi:tryptophanyl-tRNA synthetase
VPRILSGVQPTGNTHLGNYVGAFRQWVEMQHDFEAFYPVVDLHAITLAYDHRELADRTLEVAAILLACGLDPEVCTVFVQSHVPEHTELAWLFNHLATVGELRRMTQFKAKAAEGGEGPLPAGYFNYPVLQAADILIYQADRVPVGEDQRQHLELTRDAAMRFNARYGETFVVPAAAIPAAGARIMDLQNPTNKMSKSVESPQGTLRLLDEPKVIERKIKRAVTDTDVDVRFDPAEKPGVSNLLSILAVATGEEPKALADRYEQYGPLKADTAAAVVELLRPVQERYAELVADPAELTSTLAAGADKARTTAARTLARAREAVGLLPRP